MKRLILAAALVLVASIAVAVPYHGNIIKYPFWTDAAQTVPVSGSIEYQVTGTNCRMFINSSSANSIALTSGTRYEANLPLSTTSLVFKCTAGTNYIYIIK